MPSTPAQDFKVQECLAEGLMKVLGLNPDGACGKTAALTVAREEYCLGAQVANPAEIGAIQDTTLLSHLWRQWTREQQHHSGSQLKMVLTEEDKLNIQSIIIQQSHDFATLAAREGPYTRGQVKRWLMQIRVK
jgi:hypothetical protein